MTEFQIFVEGTESLKLPLLGFIDMAVPGLRRRVKIRLGKSREETMKDFLRALAENPKQKCLLLVDSEGPDDGKLLTRLRSTSFFRKHTRTRPSPAQIYGWFN